MKSVSLACVLLLAGCTQQQVYEVIQSNEQAECQREVRTNAYLECMEDTGMSYEEYAREREAVLEGD